MDKTKAELYGKVQELKHENEQLKKQLILKQQSNERTKH
jgi:cell shape-determining protein MreC